MLARLILAAAMLLPLELIAIGAAWLFGLSADDVASWMTNPAINARILAGFVAAAVLPLPFLLKFIIRFCSHKPLYASLGVIDTDNVPLLAENGTQPEYRKITAT